MVIYILDTALFSLNPVCLYYNKPLIQIRFAGGPKFLIVAPKFKPAGPRLAKMPHIFSAHKEPALLGVT